MAATKQGPAHAPLVVLCFRKCEWREKQIGFMRRARGSVARCRPERIAVKMMASDVMCAHAGRERDEAFDHGWR